LLLFAYLLKVSNKKRLGETARLVASDYAALVSHKTAALAAMPIGSNFTYEIFFNGIGGNGTDMVTRRNRKYSFAFLCSSADTSLALG
jgi:hypothetical protein